MSVEWSEADQAAGVSLPAAFFYDPSVFQQERLRIFFRSWHLVAHVNELRNPGDFVTYGILDQSVIVTRIQSGELRAFHNACQHRGNRLIDAPRRHPPTFACAYQLWRSARAAPPRGVPPTERPKDSHKAPHRLNPVRVEVLAS